jgi:hypothetical protein
MLDDDGDPVAGAGRRPAAMQVNPLRAAAAAAARAPAPAPPVTTSLRFVSSWQISAPARRVGESFTVPARGSRVAAAAAAASRVHLAMGAQRSRAGGGGGGGAGGHLTTNPLHLSRRR